MTVTIRYELNSAGTGLIEVFPFWLGQGAIIYGEENKIEETRLSVSRGQGEVTNSFVFSHPAEIDSILVSFQANNRKIGGISYPCRVKWVDRRYDGVKPNPAFSSVKAVRIYRAFPHAEQLYDWFLSNGVATVSLCGGSNSMSRPVSGFGQGTRPSDLAWSLVIGSGVDVTAAQALLAECMKNVRQLYRVEIQDGSDDHHKGEVTIEALSGVMPDVTARSTNLLSVKVDPEYKPVKMAPMPATLFHQMLVPGLTTTQFHELIYGWVRSNGLEENQRGRQRGEQARERSRDTNNLVNVLLDLCGESVAAEVPEGVPANGVIAFYKFTGNARDSSGMNGPARLRHTQFIDGSLYVNGFYPGSGHPDGSSVEIPVNDLEYDEFTVSLSFKPIDFDSVQSPSALGAMRHNFITGGRSTRWFGLRLSQDETLEVMFNNQEFKHAFPGQSVPTNMWNTLSCAVNVLKRSVIVCFNGLSLPEVVLPQDFMMRVSGSLYHSSDKVLTMENYSTAETLHGYLRNVLVYDRALPKGELEILNRRMIEACQSAGPKGGANH